MIAGESNAQVTEQDEYDYYNYDRRSDNNNDESEDEESSYNDSRRRSRFRYRSSENEQEYRRAFREDELMNKRRGRNNNDQAGGVGGIGLGGLDNLLNGDSKNKGATEQAPDNGSTGNYSDYSQTLRPDELQAAGRTSADDLAYDKREGGVTPDGQTPPPPPPPPDLPINSGTYYLMVAGILSYMYKPRKTA